MAPAATAACLVVLAVLGTASAGADSGHSTRFDTIVADWADSYNGPPPALITVRYGKARVRNGKRFLQNATQQIPSVKIERLRAEPGELYTMIMVDPDAPSPTKPIYRNYLHWILANVRIGTSASLRSATEVMSYAGPSPPMGVHRYYILVFKQNGRINATIASRQQFSVRDFSSQHELGFPVGGVFFTVEAGF